MSLCLSRDEIAEMARTRFKAKQVKFLRNNGIKHYLDDYGWPVVTRATVEGRQDEAQTVAPWKPNKAA